MSRKKIKPPRKTVNDACPFCGDYRWQFTDDADNHNVFCTDCGAKGPVANTKEQAFKRWISRSRPNPATQQKPV